MADLGKAQSRTEGATLYAKRSHCYFFLLSVGVIFEGLKLSYKRYNHILIKQIKALK